MVGARDEVLCQQGLATHRLRTGEFQGSPRLGEARLGLTRLDIERPTVKFEQRLTGDHLGARLDPHIGDAQPGQLDPERHLLPGGDRTGGDHFALHAATRSLGDRDGHGGGRRHSGRAAAAAGGDGQQCDEKGGTQVDGHPATILRPADRG